MQGGAEYQTIAVANIKNVFKSVTHVIYFLCSWLNASEGAAQV